MVADVVNNAFFGFSAALSGINAGSLKQSVASGNIANANTDGYQAAVLELSAAAGGGVNASVSIDETPGFEYYNSSGKLTTSSNVSLVDEIMNLKMGEFMVNANAAAFKIQNDSIGTIIDTMA